MVSSYFTFLRWVFWINVLLTLIPICFIVVPQVLNFFSCLRAQNFLVALNRGYHTGRFFDAGVKNFDARASNLI